MQRRRILERYRSQVNRLTQNLAYERERIASEKDALAIARSEVEASETAQKIVQQVAQLVQQQAHSRIASVVTHCLQSVFDDPYEFVIRFERKRGRTEARPLFTRNGRELTKSGVGGGVLDVASFALRLASIMLTRPQRRRLVVLDEPFKNVHSPIYRERVRLMLETLAKDMKVQFIMSTGIDELQSGKVVEL